MNWLPTEAWRPLQHSYNSNMYSFCQAQQVSEISHNAGIIKYFSNHKLEGKRQNCFLLGKLCQDNPYELRKEVNRYVI